LVVLAELICWRQGKGKLRSLEGRQIVGGELGRVGRCVEGVVRGSFTPDVCSWWGGELEGLDRCVGGCGRHGG
jgi:hypothetical protein